MLRVMSVAVFTLAATQALAADLADYKIMKIAGKDHRAVMQAPDGTLQLVRIGDVLAEEAEIVEIAEGRIVLTRQDAQGQETVIVRVDTRGQRLERYRSSVPLMSVMDVPVVDRSQEFSDFPGGENR